MRMLLALIVGLTLSSCAPKTDTSQLSPGGLADLHRLTVAKGVNDVVLVVITANQAGSLSDDMTAQFLTIAKQVLDVIDAKAPTWQAQAQAIAVNGRQALPPAVNAAIGDYLSRVLAVLQGVQ